MERKCVDMILIFCSTSTHYILYICMQFFFQRQEVLDESISASTRARRNAEEQAKLEERKMNIKKALLLRLIVDGDYAEMVEEKKSSCEGEDDEESPTSTSSSPSRLSFSSSKKYTDALNCNSRKITPNTGTGTDGNDTPTISLPEIVSVYGEECNICLNNFQVGDRVGKMNSDEMTNSETEERGSRCTDHHAFHEECISRWLLVRDGCPICRRSYFETESTTSTESTGDSADLEYGTARE